jgi:hypothetical protein
VGLQIKDLLPGWSSETFGRAVPGDTPGHSSIAGGRHAPSLPEVLRLGSTRLEGLDGPSGSKSVLMGSLQPRLLYGTVAVGFSFPGGPPGWIFTQHLVRPTRATLGEGWGLARHRFRRVDDGLAWVPRRVLPGGTTLCLGFYMCRSPILDIVFRFSWSLAMSIPALVRKYGNGFVATVASGHIRLRVRRLRIVRLQLAGQASARSTVVSLVR